MFKLFKKITIPTETKEVTAVQTWTVRWYSRHSDFASGLQKEAEVFTDEQEAKDFAQALRDAFKLLKHTSGTQVSVDKN